MNACVLNARLYLVSLSCRKWRSEPSKCRDLARQRGSQCGKLHRFGTFFLFFHFLSTFFPLFFHHFTLVSAAGAPGEDVRAGHVDALQMSHAMLLLLLVVVSSASGIR